MVGSDKREPSRRERVARSLTHSSPIQLSDELQGRPLDEGFIRRGLHDTGRAYLSAWFAVLALVLAAVGLISGSGVLSGALLVGFAVAVLFVLLALAPIRQRNEARAHIAQAKTLQRACLKWVEDVKRFLEIRKAAEPAYPPNASLAGFIQGLHDEPEETKKERERVRRDTVRLYLEEHADVGTVLFDGLIARGKIIGVTRPHIQCPESIEQINNGMDSMETGALRLG